ELRQLLHRLQTWHRKTQTGDLAQREVERRALPIDDVIEEAIRLREGLRPPPLKQRVERIGNLLSQVKQASENLNSIMASDPTRIGEFQTKLNEATSQLRQEVDSCLSYLNA